MDLKYDLFIDIVFKGIERVSAICVREDDESQVGDQFCEEKRPGDKFKECNTQGCPAR